jgi:hypothetical protein
MFVGIDRPLQAQPGDRPYMCQVPAQNRQWFLSLREQQPGQLAPWNFRAGQRQVRNQRQCLRP